MIDSEQVRQLTVANPMLIEITRFRRRFFSFSSGNSMNSVMFTLFLIGYAILVLVVMENRQSTPPIPIVIIQTGLLTLLAPMMLYGSIAGERERRSWDLLMVAPITKAQVVAGKFIGAMTALAIAFVMFQIPVLIAALGCDLSAWHTGGADVEYGYTGAGYTGITQVTMEYGSKPWGNLLAAELTSLTFLMAVCAFTILMSARVKRGLMALGATLGTLTFLLIVYPTLAAGTGMSDSSTSDFSMFFHPFYVMVQLSNANGYAPGKHFLPYGIWGWVQTLIYFAITVVMLAWASNTLHFAENEVKFMPRGEKHA